MAKRVLLAEDEPNIVASLTFLLERAGMEVAAEMDGRAALEAALADPPDVMVLDVMLPGLDGMEILRRLRASAATSALPVIGFALLMPPFGRIFELDIKIAGVPFTLVYLFAVWALLILCAWRLSRRLGTEMGDPRGDRNA
jgi:hypothetical protein